MIEIYQWLSRSSIISSQAHHTFLFSGSTDGTEVVATLAYQHSSGSVGLVPHRSTAGEVLIHRHHLAKNDTDCAAC